MTPLQIARATGETVLAAVPSDYAAVLLLTAAGPWSAWSHGDPTAVATNQPAPLAPVAGPQRGRAADGYLIVPIAATGPVWGMLVLQRFAERGTFDTGAQRIARLSAGLLACALDPLRNTLPAGSAERAPAAIESAQLEAHRSQLELQRAQIEAHRAQMDALRGVVERLVQRARAMERLAAAGVVAADLARHIRRADLGAVLGAARAGDVEKARAVLEGAARSIRKAEVFARELDALCGDQDAIELGRLFSLVLRLCGDEARSIVAQEADAGKVRGDAGDLAVALAHLVANAVEAAGVSGHVQLDGKRAGDRVTVTVADDGPGLPAQAGQPLFSTRGRAGMGICTARGLIERHGGTLAFETEPGAGTIATVTLRAVE